MSQLTENRATRTRLHTNSSSGLAVATLATRAARKPLAAMSDQTRHSERPTGEWAKTARLLDGQWVFPDIVCNQCGSAMTWCAVCARFNRFPLRCRSRRCRHRCG